MHARPRTPRLAHGLAAAAATAAVAAAVAVALAAAAPAPAAAATAHLAIQRCAFARPPATIAFAARGLHAGARYRLRVSGRTRVRGTVRQDGTVRARVRVPAMRARPAEQVRTVSISDGKTTVSAHVRLTTFGVAIAPRPTGRSLRERFRFRVFGFLPGGTIYLHYVRPNGKLRRTVALGRPHGPCGRLVTRPRVLFPFATRAGIWRLQIDKTRAYRASAPAPRTRIALPIHAAPR